MLKSLAQSLEQKADWHFNNNKIIKNKVGKKVNIDKVVGQFCLMVMN